MSVRKPTTKRSSKVAGIKKFKPKISKKRIASKAARKGVSKLSRGVKGLFGGVTGLLALPNIIEFGGGSVSDYMAKKSLRDSGLLEELAAGGEDPKEIEKLYKSWGSKDIRQGLADLFGTPASYQKPKHGPEGQTGGELWYPDILKAMVAPPTKEEFKKWRTATDKRWKERTRTDSKLFKRRKKGGRVGRPKGVGIAERGFGKAMKNG
tara:strand:- start:683 stop:1306 length:624 start_codon:yes stop_codon:yes gene_type:complete